jgi:hypothetical protein
MGANDICDALNNESFGARTEHDHSQAIAALSSFVVSRLSYESVDPADSEKVKCFLETYDRATLERFTIDTLACKVSLVHNPLVISAEHLSKAISEKTAVNTTMEVDGNEEKVWEFPDVEEGPAMKTSGSASPRPTVILSGLFWIISMLSYIGGNWYVLYTFLFSALYSISA